MILSEWIPLWMDSYKRGTMKDTSFHQLELLARHIPVSLMSMELSEILPMHLQKFYNTFAATASKSYMDKMRVMINALFAEAVENGLCSRNPTIRLKVPYIAEKPRETFTADEVRVIVQFALNYDIQRIGVGVLVLLLTGIRRGELLGLKWSDIT